MRAFYHPDQAIHSPQQFMRYGRFVPIKDSPVRTERLIGALAKHNITPEKPAEYGTAPALTVHTPGYVRFLETAWENWAALPDHGPEVWPQYFPYWSGRPEETARRDCPATGFIGQVGWYLGDLSVPMGPDSWQSILRSSETAVTGADAILAVIGRPMRYAGHPAIMPAPIAALASVISTIARSPRSDCGAGSARSRSSMSMFITATARSRFSTTAQTC